MRIRMIHLFFIAVPLAALFVGPPIGHGEEWEERTPYYEDDAWYDISEWLDGNDYNPTDEVVGRWDDETYDWSAVSSDADNDVNSGYGYDKSEANDNWYYDYYYDNDRYIDYGVADGDGFYRQTTTYYDFDNDGVYDSFASIRDSNGDGTYDQYKYYSFGNNDASKSKDGTNNQAKTAKAGNSNKQSTAESQKASAKKHQIRGTVENTKKMKVRNGPQRLIAQVASEDGKTIVVDLGSAAQFPKDQQGNKESQTAKGSGSDIKLGTRIVATGPMIKVGDKEAVLAQTFQIGDGKEQQASRSRRTFEGKITKVKTAKVRGQQHQMALVRLKSDKQILVDLGPSEDLQTKFSEGDEVTVTGVPAKVRNQLALIATSVTKDGKKVKIDRVALKGEKRSETK